MTASEETGQAAASQLEVLESKCTGLTTRGGELPARLHKTEEGQLENESEPRTTEGDSRVAAAKKMNGRIKIKKYDSLHAHVNETHMGHGLIHKYDCVYLFSPGRCQVEYTYKFSQTGKSALNSEAEKFQGSL